MIQAVSTTLDKEWDFKTPDFRWHGMKEDGSYKYNPNLEKGTSTTTKGTPFSLWKSYYVEDAAFLFLNREDIEQSRAPSSALDLLSTAETRQQTNPQRQKPCPSPVHTNNQLLTIQRISSWGTDATLDTVPTSSTLAPPSK
jgi:hypothetical protein